MVRYTIQHTYFTAAKRQEGRQTMTNEKQTTKKEMTIEERARKVAKSPEKLANLLLTVTPEEREKVIAIVKAMTEKDYSKATTPKKATKKAAKTSEKPAKEKELSKGFAGVKSFLYGRETGNKHELEVMFSGWTEQEKETLKTLTDAVPNISQHFFLNGSKVVLVKTEKQNMLNVGWYLLDVINNLPITVFKPYDNAGEPKKPEHVENRKKQANTAKEKAIAYVKALNKAITTEKAVVNE